jgi:hypothetical protein
MRFGRKGRHLKGINERKKLNEGEGTKGIIFC